MVYVEFSRQTLHSRYIENILKMFSGILSETDTLKGYYIDDKYYDARGEYYLDKSRQVHSVTREHLVNSIFNGGWNSMFNREKNLPFIIQELGYDLLKEQK